MKEFKFTVVVEAETQKEADEVIQERICGDEDYGFPYQIGYFRDE